MAKIIVTGGAGYIGSVLVPMLLQLGHKVTVLDNFMYSPNSLLDSCHDRNLSIIKGDARDLSTLEQAVTTDIDFIIPLAAIVGAPACDLDKFGATSTNLDAIRTLCSLKFLPPIIFPNTNSGYGIGQDDIHCTEESPLHPITLYGKLKTDAENIVLSTNNAIVFRLATVFGMSPRMRLDLLVNDFVYRAVNDKFIVLFEAHFKRNYIHIRDIARAFIHSMNNFDSMKNEAYNVGLSTANLSKLELCQEIKKQVPDFYFVEAKIGEDPDKRNYIVSNDKIEATGFKPQTSLQEGIAELIKGYKIIKNNKYTNI